MLELGLDFKNVGITRIRAIYEIISQMDLFHRKKAALPVRIVADRTDRWMLATGDGHVAQFAFPDSSSI